MDPALKGLNINMEYLVMHKQELQCNFIVFLNRNSISSSLANRRKYTGTIPSSISCMIMGSSLDFLRVFRSPPGRGALLPPLPDPSPDFSNPF